MNADSADRDVNQGLRIAPVAAPPRAIHYYRAADEAAVAGVWHRAGLAAYTYLPTWQSFTLEQAHRIFVEHILSRCQIWVGRDEEKIVAFLALNRSYIDRLYVDPAQQRKGWGAQFIDLAKTLHPDGLSLHTHVQNWPARLFYEKHGFAAVKYGVSPPPESAPDVEYLWRERS